MSCPECGAGCDLYSLPEISSRCAAAQPTQTNAEEATQ